MRVGSGRGAAAGCVVLGVALCAGAVVGAMPAHAAAIVTFTEPGAHVWTVPAGVTSATFDLYGGQGGQIPATPTETGSPTGLGGRATVTMTVTPGTTLQVNVGGHGRAGPTQNDYGAAGFNGGGLGGTGFGAGGGGASDIRSGDNTPADRLVVAGGGGGDGATEQTTTDGTFAVRYSAGGAGGGLEGTAGAGTKAGGPGTQTGVGAGGAASGGDSASGAGGSGGVGGNGASALSCCGGGGGGGGYFGGGGGAYGGALPGETWGRGSAGGGGSGYGPAGTVFQSGVRVGDGRVVVTYTVPTRRPDLMVKRSTDSAYVGNNVYNSTAAGQVRAWKVAVGKSRTFDVRLQNDGNISDDVILKGGASTTRFKVTYFLGTTNVTTQMVAGTLHATHLSVGASVVYKVVIKATSHARSGDVRSVTVSARSAGTTTVDAVRAKLTVR